MVKTEDGKAPLGGKDILQVPAGKQGGKPSALHPPPEERDPVPWEVCTGRTMNFAYYIALVLYRSVILSTIMLSSITFTLSLAHFSPFPRRLNCRLCLTR